MCIQGQGSMSVHSLGINERDCTHKDKFHSEGSSSVLTADDKEHLDQVNKIQKNLRLLGIKQFTLIQF